MLECSTRRRRSRASVGAMRGSRRPNPDKLANAREFTVNDDAETAGMRPHDNSRGREIVEIRERAVSAGATRANSTSRRASRFEAAYVRALAMLARAMSERAHARARHRPRRRRWAC